MKLKINWDELDWSKRNIDLARELKCGATTVCRWRKRLNKPAPSFRLNATDKASATKARLKALEQGRYKECYKAKSQKMRGRAHGNDDKISETHLAKKEDHPSGRDHELISPDGMLQLITNAENYVRDNPELFISEDIEVRRKPNGKRYTRAGNGLQAVSNGGKKSWKGWTKS